MTKTIALACIGIAILMLSGVLLNTSSADKKKDAVLRHVVLFKFKEDATQQKIDDVISAFATLPGKISEIKEYEWGTNSSPEGLNKGLTHCFFVTFASDEARDIYLTHPAHVEFVSLLKPILEDATVVDYWTK
ncbi:Dabb family protein [Planctomicrobium sp. SH668]|uniref:Dabb family protein n=1 Tax=Planctomicrobium sp. SH668 TaxID=3448126 RepID=UPI003F5AFDA4